MELRSQALSWIVAAVVFTAGVSSSSAANINVVWTSEVGQFAPLWVTKEAKLFEKYGNHAQLIFIQGAAAAANPAKEYFALPIQEVGKKDPKVLSENLERFIDMSLVKELDARGFVDKLTQEYRVK